MTPLAIAAVGVVLGLLVGALGRRREWTFGQLLSSTLAVAVLYATFLAARSG